MIRNRRLEKIFNNIIKISGDRGQKAVSFIRSVRSAFGGEVRVGSTLSKAKLYVPLVVCFAQLSASKKRLCFPLLLALPPSFQVVLELLPFVFEARKKKEQKERRMRN
jgi:hypothetical protein